MYLYIMQFSYKPKLTTYIQCLYEIIPYLQMYKRINAVWFSETGQNSASINKQQKLLSHQSLRKCTQAPCTKNVRNMQWRF